MSPQAIQILATVLKAVFVVLLVLSFVPFLIWLERKGASFIQDRIGPQRAALFGFIRLAGLVHIIADAIKLFFKEDVVPEHVEKFYYFLAPTITAMVALSTFAIVPFADHLVIGHIDIPMQVLDVNIGMIWFLAISSLAVYGIVFAGWASNSKYPLLGGVRSSAQLLSYEIPMGLSLVGSFIIWGTLNLNDIVRAQGALLYGVWPRWGIVLQPIGALIFMVCAFAETNRAPFDLAEGESELVAGYHTEYSSMKFGLFYFSEYIGMFVSSALITTLFFGGWQIPWLDTTRLMDWANPLLAIGLFVAGLAAFGSAWLLARHRARLLTRGFQDGREKESGLFSVVALVSGLVMWGCIWLVLTHPFPLWGRNVFAVVAQFGCFLTKVLFFCWVFVWVRWTLPRFRYDQLMNLGWKGLLPLALANIAVTGLVVLWLQHLGVAI